MTAPVRGSRAPRRPVADPGARRRGARFGAALAGLALAGAALLPATEAAAATAALTDELLLPAHDQTDAYTPAVAFGAGGYLVAWQAGRLMNGNLVAVRLDGAGAPADAAPWFVSAADDDQERPDVAFGGGVFLIVWQDLRHRADYDVRAARVTPAGEVLDADAILVAGGEHNQANPRVAFDGTDFVVAWEAWQGGLYEVVAARVGADGVVRDPAGIPVARAPSGQWPGYHRFMPEVASAGDGQSLVLWHGGTHWWEGRGSYWGAVFLRAGAVEHEIDYTEAGAAAAPGPACVFSVAAGPDNWLATWRNLAAVGRGNPSTNANLTLIDRDGTPGAALALLGAPHQILEPSAAWDGTEYLTAWGEQRAVAGQTFDQVLAVATSPTDGAPLTPEVFVAGTFASPARHAALASDGARAALVAYERHPATADEPIRVGVRLLTVE